MITLSSHNVNRYEKYMISSNETTLVYYLDTNNNNINKIIL